MEYMESKGERAEWEREGLNEEEGGLYVVLACIEFFGCQNVGIK